VHALALPLFIITPRVSADRRWSELTRTGAALIRFVVNVAALTAGKSEINNPRSIAFPLFRPQATAAARNPRGAVTPPSISTNPDSMYQASVT
jgi:hypothetical protein